MRAARITKALVLIPALVLVSLVCLSCEDTAEHADTEATRKNLAEMRSQVGLPNIINFTEAKFAKQIAELRDQSIRTWTYYVDYNGRRHLLCESIGYGLPYSVQLTNPMRLAGIGASDSTAMPQAEPNGLYMPESAEATWIMCSDGKGGIAPVYSEERLIVAPFPLGHIDAADNSGFSDRVSIERLTSPGVKIQ